MTYSLFRVRNIQICGNTDPTLSQIMSNVKPLNICYTLSVEQHASTRSYTGEKIKIIIKKIKMLARFNNIFYIQKIYDLSITVTFLW